MIASKSRSGISKTFVGSVLALWFLLALAGSLSGTFQVARSQPPVLIGLAITLPVILFVIVWYRSGMVQRFVSSLDTPTIILLQVGRVIGAVFLVLYATAVLPGLFALPAGIGDVLTGLAAPFIAWRVSSKAGSWRGSLIAWNIFGLLDLVVAVSLGVLNSPSPLGVLAGTTTTAALAGFPLSLIPTFLVPFYFALHLITLRYALGQGEYQR